MHLAEELLLDASDDDDLGAGAGELESDNGEHGLHERSWSSDDAAEIACVELRQQMYLSDADKQKFFQVSDCMWILGIRSVVNSFADVVGFDSQLCRAHGNFSTKRNTGGASIQVHSPQRPFTVVSNPDASENHMRDHVCVSMLDHASVRGMSTTVIAEGLFDLYAYDNAVVDRVKSRIATQLATCVECVQRSPSPSFGMAMIWLGRFLD